MRTKLESEYRVGLIEDLETLFPGCFIYHLDPAQFQGIPDLLVLWRNRWGILETKRGSKSAKQPNQDYYVEKFGEMSFSAFINPQNHQEVLSAMERAFLDDVSVQPASRSRR